MYINKQYLLYVLLVLYCLCSFVCCVLFESGGVLFCVMRVVFCVVSYCNTTATV
jgi:hypothetical protein